MPPRILFIDVAPFAGGAQDSFRTLIECAENCDQALAMGDGLWEWARQKNFPSLKLTTTHWRANLWGGLQYCWECWQNRAPLLDFIRSFRPDIIHCNTVRSALVLCALPRLETRIIVHDRDLRMPLLARRHVARKLSPFIFAVSSTVCEKWREVVPDDHRIVLHNGFDLEAIARTVPALPDTSQKTCGAGTCYDGEDTVATPCVIIAADFEPWKKHRLFLKAFQLAQAERSQLHAILKGRQRPSSSKYLEELRNHVKECQMKNVRFIVDDTPALPWIASAQVLVTCSENEPFGRTAIEALALGKRVVATEAALAPELFQLDGVTRCSPTALDFAQSILKAIEQPHPSPDLTPFSKETLAKELSKLYSLIQQNNLCIK
ncbi:MAG: glycosyltransferase family 4 protein [Victivallales bacterium]|nr:glycosyltransferase family 4 protein [Victivallales bacterium]